MDASNYGYQVELPNVDHAQAIAAITEALGAQGFGVLTEIDIRATLKKKLDADIRAYTIHGGRPAPPRRARCDCPSSLTSPGGGPGQKRGLDGPALRHVFHRKREKVETVPSRS